MENKVVIKRKTARANAWLCHGRSDSQIGQPAHPLTKQRALFHHQLTVASF